MMQLSEYGNSRALYAGWLQQLPTECHWAVADSALLQAIALNKPVQRGPRGRRLEMLVRLFAKIRLVYLLLLVVGAIELVRLLLQQRRESGIAEPGMAGLAGEFQLPAFYFVGFGAGAEEQLFARYCAEIDSPVGRIDQTKVETMGRLRRVGILRAFKTLFRSVRLARQAMAHLPEIYKSREVDFLTFIGLRISYFSYVSAWFEKLPAHVPDIREVCFLAADTAAFAAANTGLPTRFMQHGLMRRSEVLPHFNRVDALTHDESDYFRQHLPRAAIYLARTNSNQIPDRDHHCILVASIYGRYEEMRRILPFLEVAAQLGVAIHVRPHPRENLGFWQTVRLPFDVSMEDRDATFDDALDRLQPALVVSWFSTALVDALYRGVIPVSVSACDDPDIQDMVYPLFKHCLHWPTDQVELKKIIADRDSREQALARLRDGME